MIFHTKCGIFLVLCTINTMKQCVAEDDSDAFQNEDSDEEDAIKEALLLVELLKNVQDKTFLRTIDSPVDNATCKPTTLEPHTPYQNETSSSINFATKTEASLPSKPDEQFPQHRRAFMPNSRRMDSPHVNHDHHHHSPNDQQVDYYRPRGFFRRRFPDYYYFQNYFDYPRVNKEKPLPGFRRFQNNKIEESSSVSPVKTTSTTVSPLTSATNTLIKATRTELKNNNNSHPTRKKPVTENKRAVTQKFKKKLEKIRRRFIVKPITKGPISTTKPTLETTLKTTTDKKIVLVTEEKEKTTKGTVTKDQTTKDPLKDQIASELHKELNGSKIVDKHKFIINHLTGNKRERTRTTLRIHLDGSTRYNIPFPENHAFCFTNPENILCRSPL